HVLEDWADESLYFYEMRLRFGMPHNRSRTLPKLLAHENAVMKTVAPFILPRAIDGQTRAQGVGRKSDEQVLSDVRRHLDALEALLAGRETLVGDRLSLADVGVFCMLYCIDDSREGAAEIGRRPAVAAFMEHVDRATAAP
ncbi:MAG: glutathione binding-like protein, partial [Candidatus Binatia bacterium]